MNAPHAITAANAKMPPASRRSVRRNASAFARSSTKISSAHAEYAAAPNCPERYESAPMAAKSTVSPPV